MLTWFLRLFWTIARCVLSSNWTFSFSLLNFWTASSRTRSNSRFDSHFRSKAKCSDLNSTLKQLNQSIDKMEIRLLNCWRDLNLKKLNFFRNFCYFLGPLEQAPDYSSLFFAGSRLFLIRLVSLSTWIIKMRRTKSFLISPPERFRKRQRLNFVREVQFIIRARVELVQFRLFLSVARRVDHLLLLVWDEILIKIIKIYFQI